VLRDGIFVKVPAADVVPGDVAVLAPGKTYCDMVVVKADCILVDESALTGEATPVGKSEFDRTMKSMTYCPRVHKANTISAATTILEVGGNGKQLGLILKTGSFTTKGALLSDVLSYERHPLKFDDEVKIVLIILVLEAIFLLGIVFYFLQNQWVFAWFYGRCTSSSI
jgi:P-type Mg2+ transporter